MSDPVFRLLPRVTPENAFFWEGGADGKLRFLQCRSCQYLIHPPAPLCPECLGRELEASEVSGRATVYTYTVNHHPWIPGFPPPYVVAIVEIEEQPSVRLTTNIVDCAIDEVKIGMSVEVRFEEREDGIFLPLFAPSQTASARSGSIGQGEGS
jgi:uncharacterized OB-fold protein